MSRVPAAGDSTAHRERVLLLPTALPDGDRENATESVPIDATRRSEVGSNAPNESSGLFKV